MATIETLTPTLLPLQQPSYWLPEDVTWLPWERESHDFNIRWQHFREVYGMRWGEPGDAHQGHWLFAGILDDVFSRPVVDPNVGQCRLPGPAIITVEGEWQNYHTYARLNGPNEGDAHPTVACVRTSAPERAQAVLRHVRILNRLAQVEYGEPLCFPPNMEDAQRRLIQPLIDGGEVDMHFDTDTYYEYFRFGPSEETVAA